MLGPRYKTKVSKQNYLIQNYVNSI